MVVSQSAGPVFLRERNAQGSGEQKSKTKRTVSDWTEEKLLNGLVKRSAKRPGPTATNVLG